MAPLWIKVTHWTPDKPEVFCVAELLNIDPDAVVGKLVRIWIWADQQLETCCAVSVTKASLDRIACVTGFADALEKVGWLEQRSDGLEFSNFDRHNGATAKKRAQAAKRMEKSRNRDAASATKAQRKANKRDDSSVTKASPDEEEDEEIKDINHAHAKPEIESKFSNGFIPPTWEELELHISTTGYAREAVEKFFDYNCTVGWMTKKGPMADWQAALRQWMRNEKERRSGTQGCGYKATGTNPSGIVQKSSYVPAEPLPEHRQTEPF